MKFMMVVEFVASYPDKFSLFNIKDLGKAINNKIVDTHRKPEEQG